MPDTEQISQPSLGSNELGTNTNDTHIGNKVSSGTDTQLHLAAKGGKSKHLSKEQILKDNLKGVDFAKQEDTDE